MITPLILKRASASRSSGQWSDDDYDVLENGVVVGRKTNGTTKVRELTEAELDAVSGGLGVCNLLGTTCPHPQLGGGPSTGGGGLVHEPIHTK
jgi:hypothetical protein